MLYKKGQQNKYRIYRDKSLCAACGKCAEVCETGASQLIGKRIRAEDIIQTVMNDKPFYDNSGGGVTFSGGEPTAQKHFLLELLKISKENGLHTALETCGFFNGSLINRLVSLTDLFLFDIKHIDSNKHKEFTGADNELILQNFASLLQKAGHERVTARIPLIPGFNMDSDSIKQIATFLKALDFSGMINLMPYNPLYKTKFEKTGRINEFKNMGILDNQMKDNVKTQLISKGLNCI